MDWEFGKIIEQETNQEKVHLQQWVKQNLTISSLTVIPLHMHTKSSSAVSNVDS